MTLSVAVRRSVSPAFALDLAFEAEPGVTIVFGESGSGKTTLLRCVAGLTTPDRGRIAVHGQELFNSATHVDVDPSRRRVGFVFQHLALFPHMTAWENIAYGLASLPADERHQRVAAIAESFRIHHLLARRPREISGGERQRVGLARSLVTSPDVLLLDEPLSALDHATQSRIMADIRAWNESRKIPILYVTHSQREVFALGERVLLLERGALAAAGTPQQVMDAPMHDALAQLLGFENLLDGVVVNRSEGTGTMTVRLGGTGVELETPLVDLDPGGRLRVAVRAGDILLATERPVGLSARNILPSRIARLSHESAHVRADVSLGAVMVEVHLTPRSSEDLGLHPGKDVWLVIKTHSCRPVAAA